MELSILCSSIWPHRLIEGCHCEIMYSPVIFFSYVIFRLLHRSLICTCLKAGFIFEWKCTDTQEKHLIFNIIYIKHYFSYNLISFQFPLFSSFKLLSTRKFYNNKNNNKCLKMVVFSIFFHIMDSFSARTSRTNNINRIQDIHNQYTSTHVTYLQCIWKLTYTVSP